MEKMESSNGWIERAWDPTPRRHPLEPSQVPHHQHPCEEIQGKPCSPFVWEKADKRSDSSSARTPGHFTSCRESGERIRE